MRGDAASPRGRVAITGAAGYLGTRLARRCAGEEWEILGLDVAPAPEGWPAGAAFQRQDVTRPGLGDRLSAFGADVLVHLAWIFDPQRDAERERAVDLDGTVRTLGAAASSGVRRVVYPSSTTAYGIHPHRTLAFREEDPPTPNPRYRYAYHKARVEQWLPGFRAAHPDLELVVLRPCIVVGPRADNVVTRIADLPLMPRVAGHDPPVQFLHEEDAAEVLYLSILDAPPGTYNVAGDGVVRYTEICKLAGRPCLPLPPQIAYRLVGVAWRARLLDFPPGLLDYVRYPWVADNARLKSEFGYRPVHGSREAFGDYVEARRGGSGGAG